MSNSTTQNNTQTTGNTMDTMIEQVWALYPMVNKNLAIRTGNQELAHDLTQDTLIKAIENIGKFDSEKANLKTWVMSISWRVFLDSNKSYHNKNVTSGYDSATLDAMAGGYEFEYTEDVAGKDVWATVASIVNTKEYGILVRRFRDDMSYVEIAADMGIPKGSVMSGLSNGKRKLRESNTFVGMFQ